MKIYTPEKTAPLFFVFERAGRPCLAVEFILRVESSDNYLTSVIIGKFVHDCKGYENEYHHNE